MAKILTDKEMGQIVFDATHRSDVIECADAYEHFLEDLGELIVSHFGGTRGHVGYLADDVGWACGFLINECVPADGGVFKDYDTDITWADGVENEDTEAIREEDRRNRHHC